MIAPRRRQTTLKALGILAGCPDGATEDALAKHGIERAVLWRLVQAGHATVQKQRFARLKNLEVDRFHITAAGRAAINP